jgi:hypothetical protein
VRTQDSYLPSAWTSGLATRASGVNFSCREFSDVRQNVSNITHLGDALTLIQAYVATVTCGTNPQVRAQNRYLPPS